MTMVRFAATIGLAIDAGWVCAVQPGPERFGGSGRAVRFRRLEPDTPLSAAEANRIMEVLERHGFTGRRIAIAAPEDKLITTMLQLPAGLDDEALAPVVRMEMARAASSRPDTLQAGHVAVAANPRNKQRRAVHGAALRHEDAEALMEPLLAAGADLVAIEPAGVAALRAVQPLAGADPEAVVSVLDLGWDRAQVIVARGGSFAYARTDAELSLKDLVARTARLTGLAPAVAERAIMNGAETARPAVRRQLLEMAQRLGQLAEAAQTYVLQAYSNSRDAGLLAHGPGTAIPGLLELAAGQVDMGFTRVVPSMVAPLPRGRYTDNPALVTATGLAMSEDGQ